MGLSTITPETRSEEFIDRIARAMGSGGTSPLDTIVPETRHEEFIDRIARANGWTDVSPMASIYPETRMEEFLNRIADNAGGSLEYESGTIIPETDIEKPEISFANEHTTAPSICVLEDATGNYEGSANYLAASYFVNWGIFTGENLYQSTTDLWYVNGQYKYRSTANTTTLQSGTISVTDPATILKYCTNEKFCPVGDISQRLLIAGRIYKWVAIWLTL